jgi:hypothetical protein
VSILPWVRRREAAEAQQRAAEAAYQRTRDESAKEREQWTAWLAQRDQLIKRAAVSWEAATHEHQHLRGWLISDLEQYLWTDRMPPDGWDGSDVARPAPSATLKDFPAPTEDIREHRRRIAQARASRDERPLPGSAAAQRFDLGEPLRGIVRDFIDHADDAGSAHAIWLCLTAADRREQARCEETAAVGAAAVAVLVENFDHLVSRRKKKRSR